MGYKIRIRVKKPRYGIRKAGYEIRDKKNGYGRRKMG